MALEAVSQACAAAQADTRVTPAQHTSSRTVQTCASATAAHAAMGCAIALTGLLDVTVDSRMTAWHATSVLETACASKVCVSATKAGKVRRVMFVSSAMRWLTAAATACVSWQTQLWGLSVCATFHFLGKTVRNFRFAHLASLGAQGMAFAILQLQLVGVDLGTTDQLAHL